MNLENLEKRKQVYLAIDDIFRMRMKGNLAVKRWEVIKRLPDMSYTDLDLAIRWLAGHDLLLRDEASAGWLINKKVDLKTFCWLHGKVHPCKSCKRTKFTKRGMTWARK